jgi:cytochrome c oxidase cbb3-type subunit 3
VSTGWSWYVIALVALNLLGCVWLLWWTAKRRPGDPKPEETSHYWDGDITEYNKPMPRWWINGFYLLLVFSVVYIFWYGGLGGYEGYGKWSSAGEHALAKAADDARLEETFAPYKGQPIDAICTACHGKDGKGNPQLGAPDLTDEYWLYGDSTAQLSESIAKGRHGVMPGWRDMLGETRSRLAAAYVWSLSHPAGAATGAAPAAEETGSQ